MTAGYLRRVPDADPHGDLEVADVADVRMLGEEEQAFTGAAATRIVDIGGGGVPRPCRVLAFAE